jgi:hypothetical protein
MNNPTSAGPTRPARLERDEQGRLYNPTVRAEGLSPEELAQLRHLCFRLVENTGCGMKRSFQHDS